MAAYYANPQNHFWTILYEIGLTPIKIAPQDYRQLLNYKIGLTDLCKFVSGNNNELPSRSLVEGVPELKKKIVRYRRRFLAFTDPTAGRKYIGNSNADLGKQPSGDGTTIYILPSPSPRNTQWSKHKQAWQHFADEVHRAGVDPT